MVGHVEMSCVCVPMRKRWFGKEGRESVQWGSISLPTYWSTASYPRYAVFYADFIDSLDAGRGKQIFNVSTLGGVQHTRLGEEASRS